MSNILALNCHYGSPQISKLKYVQVGHTIYVIVKNYTFIAYLGKHILASYTNNSSLAFTLKKTSTSYAIGP